MEGVALAASAGSSVDANSVSSTASDTGVHPTRMAKKNNELIERRIEIIVNRNGGPIIVRPLLFKPLRGDAKQRRGNPQAGNFLLSAYQPLANRCSFHTLAWL